MRVAMLLQFSKPAFFSFTGPAAGMAEDSRMAFGGKTLAARDGFSQAATAPLRDVPRQEWLNRLGERGRSGNPDQRIVAQDEERRLVGGDRFLFPPLPQLAQDGQGRRFQQVAAFDAPDGVQIRQVLPRRVLDELRA